MNEEELKSGNAPIVEAVVDIDCDMQPSMDIASLEKRARDAFGSQYPIFRALFVENHRFEAKAGQSMEHSAQHTVQAFQFFHDDEKQLVQVRMQGFSFNRLAPYTRLSDYLPEIERTWELFRDIASPALIQVVRLRYINRIPLPLTAGRVTLDKYLKLGPRVPNEEGMTLHGFFNQHTATEAKTGHQANTVLTSQPAEGDTLPVIFDNTVAAAGPAEPDDWPWILDKIQSLRSFKNRIFINTLTEECLNLFQK